MLIQTLMDRGNEVIKEVTEADQFGDPGTSISNIIQLVEVIHLASGI